MKNTGKHRDSYLFAFIALSLIMILASYITVNKYSRNTDGKMTNETVFAGTSCEQTKESVPDTEAIKEIKPDFVFPLDGKITSGFAWREDPFHDESSGTKADIEFHRGIDISASKSKDIMSCCKGTVSKISRSPGYGNYLMIDHDGFVSLYAHCSAILCNVGDEVNAGDTIAVAGATGRATGVHLHFEIRVNGEFADPLDYVGTVYAGAEY